MKAMRRTLLDRELTGLQKTLRALANLVSTLTQTCSEEWRQISNRQFSSCPKVHSHRDLMDFDCSHTKPRFPWFIRRGLRQPRFTFRKNLLLIKQVEKNGNRFDPRVSYSPSYKNWVCDQTLQIPSFTPLILRLTSFSCFQWTAQKSAWFRFETFL